MGKSRNKSIPDWISDNYKYDWDRLRLPLKGRSHRSALRKNYVRLQGDQLFGVTPCTIGVAATPANLRLQIAAFNPTECGKRLCKSG